MNKYGASSTAFGRLVVENTSGWGLTVSEYVTGSVAPAASVTVTVKLDVPMSPSEGVPVSAPVSGSNVAHDGAPDPAVYVSGAIAVGNPIAIDGSVESLDLAVLPIAKYVDGLNLRGSLDAEIDLHYDAEENWIGSVTLSVEDGSVGLPGQPVAIPFATLDAQLSLGPEDGTFLMTSRSGRDAR